jgi:hypothetical protein
VALAAAVCSPQEEGFPQLFDLQQADVAPFDTVGPTGQGRGQKLVTEGSKPVGSGLTIRKLLDERNTAVFFCFTRIDLWQFFSDVSSSQFSMKTEEYLSFDEQENTKHQLSSPS